MILRLHLHAIQVLSQCPLLSEVYVDAWPITSYLRMALKEHKTAGYRPKEGRKHKNGRLKVCL